MLIKSICRRRGTQRTCRYESDEKWKRRFSRVTFMGVFPYCQNQESTETQSGWSVGAPRSWVRKCETNSLKYALDASKKTQNFKRVIQDNDRHVNVAQLRECQTNEYTRQIPRISQCQWSLTYPILASPVLATSKPSPLPPPPLDGVINSRFNLANFAFNIPK